ncbi:MAG: response regulator [Planctomycetes bacterium]|nr:response regulator [Planctomycetota bacterium]
MARLLLIDDDALLARVLAEYLQRTGFEVEIAAGGGEALRALAAGGWEAVVVDVIVPDASPEDLLAAIPRGPAGPAVVAVSGAPPAPAIAARLVREGIPFIQKPFRPDALVRLLEKQRAP